MNDNKGNILAFNGLTCGHVPVSKVLSSAITADLSHVLILGLDKNGETYLASSDANAENLLLCEKFKHFMVTGEIV